jgi:hypothetical protein
MHIPTTQKSISIFFLVSNKIETLKIYNSHIHCRSLPRKLLQLLFNNNIEYAFNKK